MSYLEKSSEWYSERGYLIIDLELFTKYLCLIFDKYLGGYHYCQKFTPTVRTDKNRPVWLQGGDRRDLVIISKKGGQDYNKEVVINANDSRSNNLEPFTLSSKENVSLFTKAPIKLDKEDFLIYFGDYDYKRISIDLGFIAQGVFVPNRFERPKIFCLSCGDEISYSNPIYPFIEEFMIAIFYYKVNNRKPNIDDEDMELILEQRFGISRKEKRQRLINDLKVIMNEATQLLLNSESVSKILKK